MVLSFVPSLFTENYNRTINEVYRKLVTHEDRQTLIDILNTAGNEGDWQRSR